VLDDTGSADVPDRITANSNRNDHGCMRVLILIEGEKHIKHFLRTFITAKKSKNLWDYHGYPVTSTPKSEKCESFVTTDALTDNSDAAMIASAMEIPGRFIVPASTAISGVSGILIIIADNSEFQYPRTSQSR